MQGSQPQRRGRVPGLGFDDDIGGPGAVKPCRELSIDIVGQSVIGNDENVLFRDKGQHAAHGLLNQRIDPPDLQELLGHFFAGERPEPCAGTTGHDNSVHKRTFLAR